MGLIKENYAEDVTVDYTTHGVKHELFKCYKGHEELYDFLQFIVSQMEPGEGWDKPEFHSSPGSNRVLYYHGDACEWIVNGTKGVVSGSIAAFTVGEDGKVSAFKQYHTDGPAMEEVSGSRDYISVRHDCLPIQLLGFFFLRRALVEGT